MQKTTRRRRSFCFSASRIGRPPADRLGLFAGKPLQTVRQVPVFRLSLYLPSCNIGASCGARVYGSAIPEPFSEMSHPLSVRHREEHESIFGLGRYSGTNFTKAGALGLPGQARIPVASHQSALSGTPRTYVPSTCVIWLNKLAAVGDRLRPVTLWAWHGLRACSCLPARQGRLMASRRTYILHSRRINAGEST